MSWVRESVPRIVSETTHIKEYSVVFVFFLVLFQTETLYSEKRLLKNSSHLWFFFISSHFPKLGVVSFFLTINSSYNLIVSFVSGRHLCKLTKWHLYQISNKHPILSYIFWGTIQIMFVHARLPFWRMTLVNLAEQL